MGFLSGWNQSGGRNKFTKFAHNTFDRNNDGKVGGWEAVRTGLSFLNPMGAASNLVRGGYNMYKDSHPSQGQPQSPFEHQMPERPSMTGQFYGGDLGQNMNLPQFGLGGGGDMYAGGSATFNEKTGNYATQPQNGFLSGFNPTAGQYRGIQMNQARDDRLNNYLSNQNASNPFGYLNPGDRAIENHTAHVNKMDALRWAGDMNPAQAQAEFNDQNAARYKASMMYK